MSKVGISLNLHVKGKSNVVVSYNRFNVEESEQEPILTFDTEAEAEEVGASLVGLSEAKIKSKIEAITKQQVKEEAAKEATTVTEETGDEEGAEEEEETGDGEGTEEEETEGGEKVITGTASADNTGTENK